MIEKGSLRAQRFLTAIDLHAPEHLENISRSLWTRVWSKVRKELTYNYIFIFHNFCIFSF